MQSHYIYQDTNISLQIGFKNIRRSSPTRHQNWPLETQVEETNQDANLAEGFAVLTSTLNKLNLTNMPNSTKDYIVRKATCPTQRRTTSCEKRHHYKTGHTTFDNNNSNNRQSQKHFFWKSYQTGRCVRFTGAGSCVGAHGNASGHE
jgi:hypothetical protein